MACGTSSGEQPPSLPLLRPSASEQAHRSPVGCSPPVLQTPLRENRSPSKLLGWKACAMRLSSSPARLAVLQGSVFLCKPGWMWWRWKQEEEFPLLRKSSASFMPIFSPPLPQALLLLCSWCSLKLGASQQQGKPGERGPAGLTGAGGDRLHLLPVTSGFAE